MPWPFYMDVHIPAAITDGLLRLGIDVLTCQQDDTCTTEDKDLLSRTHSLSRILFTQDDDFLTITAAWLEEEKEFSGVVYGHQLNTNIGQCIEDLELIATLCSYEEIRNRVIYLPL